MSGTTRGTLSVNQRDGLPGQTTTVSSVSVVLLEGMTVRERGMEIEKRKREGEMDRLGGERMGEERGEG